MLYDGDFRPQIKPVTFCGGHLQVYTPQCMKTLTNMSPIWAAASCVIIHSLIFGAQIPNRSPFVRPLETSPSASASTWKSLFTLRINASGFYQAPLSFSVVWRHDWSSQYDQWSIISFSAVSIYDLSHIHLYLYHPRVWYYELTTWPVSEWLDSSVGGALHRSALQTSWVLIPFRPEFFFRL